jgi:hypothetical protein
VTFNGIDVLAQLLHSARIEDVCPRLRPIERQHANAIVSDLALNQGTFGDSWH